jgi:endonuclease/exonuclease/phosphatase family metal-dependent hydrolase
MALPESPSNSPSDKPQHLLEFGEPATRRPSTPPRSTLIVASYNIRYAVGEFLISSGLFRKAGLNFPLQRAVAVGKNIRTAAKFFMNGVACPPPDVLALQEADKRTARAGGHHVACELAEELGMSWIHAGADIPRGRKPQPRQWWLDFEEQIGLYDEGDTGVALITNQILSEVSRIDLPWKECPWRPRLALGATLAIDGRQVRLLNSHIDPHTALDGHMEQLEVVVKEADRSNLPVILLGDFNTLSKRKCIDTRLMLEAQGFSTPLPTGTPTWRGAGIRLHADWIFVRELKVNRWGVARPLSVSDHWPIWAEIALK